LRGAAAEGAIDLYYLDEAGFAPTLPTGHTWARRGVRPLVPYEAPHGRRLNALGALAPFGPAPRLVFETRLASEGKLDSAAFLAFVCGPLAQLPAPHDALDSLPRDYRRARDCVVVLDNYQVHKSALVRAARARLADAGVLLYELPPYSPHLNRMEPEWHAVKYRGCAVRSHATGATLKAAVDSALAGRARHCSAPHLRDTA
jgi:hypothetical protein